MREAARIKPMPFAREAGWADSSLVTAVELGRRTITEHHVRVWCRICRASDVQTEAFLAERSAVAGMWLANQQLIRGGLKRAQEEEQEKYAQARMMRFYATKGVPGLLQTEGYATHALRSIRMELRVEHDDVAEAVTERMARNAAIRRAGRFLFVLEEDVLWHRTVPLDVHREQLHRLREAMRWPSVSLGVIPRTADRSVNGFGVWPDESFLITDARLVNVELVSGYLSLTQPDEVDFYVRAWDRLFALAVFGDPVARMIESALAGLGRA